MMFEPPVSLIVFFSSFSLVIIACGVTAYITYKFTRYRLNLNQFGSESYWTLTRQKLFLYTHYKNVQVSLNQSPEKNIIFRISDFNKDTFQTNFEYYIRTQKAAKKGLERLSKFLAYRDFLVIGVVGSVGLAGWAGVYVYSDYNQDSTLELSFSMLTNILIKKGAFFSFIYGSWLLFMTLLVTAYFLTPISEAYKDVESYMRQSEALRPSDSFVEDFDIDIRKV